MDKIEELLTRGVANIIPGKAELEKLLKSGKKLNVYFGIDPTATKIHLGNAVPLRKLQKLAELGHNVTFLIGDFTALVGDTSDKNSERPILTPEEIEENFKTYKKQAEKIVDFSKITIRKNSEWLSKLSFKDTIGLMQKFSLNDFISRELIRKRLDEGKRVRLDETAYPLMQGYDSFFLDTDVQVGGTDQTFNMQAGRTLIKDLRKGKESFVLTTPILEGPDGRKMSKSYGNAIWLDDNPNDMYAKVMSIDDGQIMNYFRDATNWSLNKIDKEIDSRLKSENPINVKKELAHTIVKELHDESLANEAQEKFEKTVQNKELPRDIEALTINVGDSVTVADNLVKANLVQSRSEVKRLVEQEGIRVNDKIIDNTNFELKAGDLLKVGKRRVVKISSK